MAVEEHHGLWIYKDKNGDKHLLLPVTDVNGVDGLEDLLNGKADRKVPATAGNLAALDATGNLADSGWSADTFDARLTAMETQLGQVQSGLNAALYGG